MTTALPYVPRNLVPSHAQDAPVRLRVDLAPAQAANELHAQLSRHADGRALHDLRAQARAGFRTVLRHVRARRAEGFADAPFELIAP